jgi:uncharacterized protein (TIGR02099 family)
MWNASLTQMRFFRLLTALLAGIIVFFGLVIGIARLLLPSVEDYRTEIETWAGKAIGAEVKIASIETDWDLINPVFMLNGVDIDGLSDEDETLHLKSLGISVDAFSSLFSGRLLPATIMLKMHKLHVIRDESGRYNFNIAESGQDDEEAVDRAVIDWMLQQTDLLLNVESLYIEDRKSKFPDISLQSLGIVLKKSGSDHFLSIDTDTDPALAKHVRLIAEFENGTLAAYEKPDAKIYLKIDQAHLSPWRALLEDKFNVPIAGRASIELWTQLAKGRLTQLRGQVSAEGIDTGFYSIDRFSTDVFWQGDLTDWKLELDQLQLVRDADHAWPVSSHSVDMTKREGLRSYLVNSDFLRIQDVMPLFSNQPFISDQARQHIRALSSRGDLQDMKLNMSFSDNEILNYGLQANVKNLSSRAWKDIPGFSGIDGELYATKKSGLVRIQSSKSLIDLPNLFRDPIRVESLKGDLNWSRLDDGWMLNAPEIVAQNSHIKTKSRFSMHFPDTGSPFIDLQTDFHDGDGSYTSLYIPSKIMSEKAVEWLDEGIVAGDVEYGSFILYGALDDFPYDHKQGKFEVRFKVRDGILNYYHNWPRLEEVEADIAFVGRGLSINATSGKIFEADIQQTSVAIENLDSDNPILQIEGDAKTTSSDLMRYLQEAELTGTYDDAMSEMSLSGRNDLKLSLTIPLKEGHTRFSGNLEFLGNQLDIPSWDVTLTDIRGGLDFSNTKFEADNIKARFNGQPLFLDVGSIRTSSGLETHINADTQADISELVARRNEVLAQQMDGVSPVQISVQIPENSDENTRLVLQSSLNGCELRLPGSFSKAANESAMLTLRTGLSGSDARRIDVSLSDKLRASFLLDASGNALEKGVLSFGNDEASLPEQEEILIGGRLASLDIEEWLQWYQGLNLDQSQRQASDRIPWNLDLIIDNLNYKEWFLADLSISSRRDEKQRIFNLSGQSAQGEILVPDERYTEQMIDVNLKRLRFGREEEDADTEKQIIHDLAGHDLSPSDIPSFRVLIEELTYRDRKMGQVMAEVKSSERDLYLEQFDISNESSHLQLNGFWHMKSQSEHQTKLDLAMDSVDFGAFLKRLGYEDTMTNGQARIHASLDMPVPPHKVGPATLNGHADMSIYKGEIMEVQPGGAGRVFGLLSFQTLPRRLALDFSDLFSKGMTFDDIEGTFTFSDGQAYTNDLIMEAPSSSVHISGRIGLADQDYDQQVEVIPNVSSSLPIAGALAGGPALGAVLLLTHQLLGDPIDKLAKLEYQISGSWRDPEIKRIASAEKAATPSDQQPALQ